MFLFIGLLLYGIYSKNIKIIIIKIILNFITDKKILNIILNMYDVHFMTHLILFSYELIHSVIDKYSLVFMFYPLICQTHNEVI